MHYGLICPHCRSTVRVRSSRPITPTYRQMHLVCSDETCGATFGAEITITHALSPSARPDPTVHLRQAATRRRPAPPVPANDTDRRLACGPGAPPCPTAKPANDEDLKQTG